MRWVKVTDRLPDEPGVYYAKYQDFHKFKRTLEFRSNEKFYEIQTSCEIKEVAEWLDESEDINEHKAHLSEIQQKINWQFWTKEQRYYRKKSKQLKHLIKQEIL